MAKDKKEKNEFWSTARGKAIIKLGIWGVFFLVLVIISGITGGFTKSTKEDNSDETETEIVRFELYSTMLDNLSKGNYEYNYKVTNGEVVTIYHGESDGVSILGYKESNQGVIKYLINNGETFEVKVDTKELISTLYDGFDINIMDLNVLINSLSSLDYVVQKEENERVITYSDIDYEISVRTDKDNIMSININKDNIIYEFSFSNMGNVEEINISE